MKKEIIAQKLKISGESQIEINGVSLDRAYIEEMLINRIWKSANVIKNRREADNKSQKQIITEALQAELITSEQALELMLSQEKESVKEMLKTLSDKLPKTEKSEEPSEEDIDLSIALTLENKGQSA
jgi:rRNA maturation endonuclease Nob1